MRAPKATVSVNIDRDSYRLGETIAGDILVTSEDDFEAKEVRTELLGIEKLTSGEEFIEEEVEETPETQLYISGGTVTTRGNEAEYPMYRGQTRLSEKLAITKGFNQRFPFKITIPNTMGPSFQGTRRDGQWLERTWTLRGVVSAGGRPDVKANREIRISLALAPQATNA